MRPTILDRRALARLLRFLRACAPRRPRRVLLEEAEIELWGLYRREQAELLQRAAALRVPAAEASARHLRRAAGSACRAAQKTWRRQAAECAALCAHDGYPLAAPLAACLAHPAHDWPSRGALRSAALRLGARND